MKALKCQRPGCDGKVPTGQRGRQLYWDGDTYTCAKCGAVHVARVTDDYSDDARAWLELAPEVGRSVRGGDES